MKRQIINLMKAPLISVIINCHNGQKYLKSCIKSILNQDYNNFEIIFWNNSSTDKSEEIIKKFKDKRIRIFSSKKFLKLYKSRNLAINKAKGSFVTFCDTDDMWMKNKLSKQVDLLKKNRKIKFIYSNYYVLNELNKTKKLRFKTNLPSGDITQNLIENYLIGILTTMIEKKILIKYFFNPNYEIVGDFDLFMRLSTKYDFYSIQNPLAIYRIHNNNFSSKKINIYISELKRWLKENLKQNCFKNYSFFSIKFYLFKLKIKLFLNKYFSIKLGV